MPNGFLELPAELMDLGENAPMEPVLVNIFRCWVDFPGQGR